MSFLTPFLDERIFLSRDGSQQEIRMLAQLSRDKMLSKQLNTAEDIHSQVGNALYGWPIEKILHDKKTRTICKQLHFGIIFGLTVDAIYESCLRFGIKVKKSEIQKAYDKYFEIYKGVARYRQRMVAVAERDHCVRTLFGRFREVMPYGQSVSKGFWRNVAVNSGIQGSASDFLVLVMAMLYEERPKYDLLLSTLRLDVHDSLVATPTLRLLQQTDEMLQFLMEVKVVEKAKSEFGVDMMIPLVTEASVGFRLGVDVKPYDRKEALEDTVLRWVKKNAELEKDFLNNPLKNVLSR